MDKTDNNSGMQYLGSSCDAGIHKGSKVINQTRVELDLLSHHITAAINAKMQPRGTSHCPQRMDWVTDWLW